MENVVTVAGSQVRVMADQVYSRVGGVARLADVYLPEASNSRLAVVIWLHGGGWLFGDRHLAPDLLSFARETGLALVSIDYRLSDEAKFPAAVEDVKAAVRWVRSVADEFGFDGHRIGLWVHPRAATWLRVQRFRERASFSRLITEDSRRLCRRLWMATDLPALGESMRTERALQR
jgi:alpha/beta hydrolase fold